MEWFTDSASLPNGGPDKGGEVTPRGFGTGKPTTRPGGQSRPAPDHDGSHDVVNRPGTGFGKGSGLGSGPGFGQGSGSGPGAGFAEAATAFRGAPPSAAGPSSAGPAFKTMRTARSAPRSDAPAAVESTDPAAIIDRFATPMFCVAVLERDPLDVVFTGFNRAQAEAASLPQEKVVGERPAAFLPARAAANMLENYRLCLEAGAPLTYEEALGGPGGERWYRTTLTPWTNGEGAVTAIVGSSVNITDYKRRADEDARAISRLRRLSEEVRTFASMAAHDVRSPLGTVESLVELIEEGFVDQGDRKLALIRACGETARSARVQMDMLLRHASALGVEESAASACDLGRMGSEISAMIDPEGRLDITWPRRVVEADAITLQLILRNLMTNAARHCAERVTVTLDPETGGAGFAAFTVADDGPGFPEDAEPFARSSTLEQHETAHGFGLQAARYLVETRGGTIGLTETDLGGGAVRFTLPCRPA